MTAKNLLQLLLLSFIWGASFLLISIAGTSFPPVWVALIRCSLGAILLFAVLKAGDQKFPPRRLFKWLFLVALFNNAIPFTMFAWGEQTVPSSIAAVLNATTPIFAMLMTLMMAGAKPNRFTVPGVLLGFSGVVMVVWGHDAGSVTASSADFWRGIVLITIGALGYAVATLMAKKKLSGLDPIGLATTQLGLASMMLLPVALIGPHPSELRISALAAVAGLGLAGSGIAYLLYYNLLAQIAATNVTAVTYIIPIWGLFWGWIAHEPVGWIAYAGALVAIAGLGLLNFDALWGKKAEPVKAPPRTARTSVSEQTESDVVHR